jgi:hypothetical protein
VIDRHAADTGLDEPPRHQARLAERVAAVGVAEAVRLGVDVERLARLLRRHQVERLLLKDRDGASVGVNLRLDAGAEAIDRGEQFLAIGQTAGFE